MKKIIITIICIVLLCNLLKAQDCSCKANLDSLIKSIEGNYVGFNTKMNKIGFSAYDSAVKTLRDKSIDAKNYDCYEILVRYVSLFKDPHLRVLINRLSPSNVNYDSLRMIFARLPKKRINLDSIVKKYSLENTSGIEGIWSLPEFNYKVAIIKSDSANKYEAIIIKADNFKWHPGQVKMILYGQNSYKIKFFIADHTPVITKGKAQNNIMNLGEYGLWRKEQFGKVINSSMDTMIEFKILSNKTSLIKIKSSDITLRDTLDQVIGKNWKNITSKENLIIDIRNNSGGHIMTFDTLNRLYITKPIHTDAVFIKASQDNISLYSESLINPNFNEEEKKDFKELIDTLKKHIGNVTKVSNEDSIYVNGTTYPKRIFIITNSGTGSAAELFVMHAKQSQKVTVVGESTKGALDFTEIGRNRDLPCPFWQYMCPMGMGEHKYIPLIDNIGIQPDRKITEDIDWISWTLKAIENGI
ncbi:S41 family peptidase [Chitinophaga silvisoli]|uniref:Tail specific protease domain-containing protein n=1 Tax=Chitinophaga silvisoli TaxID=2291814 RepID=A0A3E1P374_9BACT|nr:S41 family peptidase [Chitinophaga silvisoli]RFM34448.1 hypothetical protein DXN04_14315 [Chitinophaga silvisoli]